MIEIGTPDEFKESVLGNVAFDPDATMFAGIKRAFDKQGLNVTVCSIVSREMKKKQSWDAVHTIAVYFTTNRNHVGALAKALRATRALRLALCHFSSEEDAPSDGRIFSRKAFNPMGFATRNQFPGNRYQVEIRGYD